jgi:actin-related protein
MTEQEEVTEIVKGIRSLTEGKELRIGVVALTESLTNLISHHNVDPNDFMDFFVKTMMTAYVKQESTHH